MARDKALGLVLAEPVVASVDLPQAYVSAMDGYVLAGPAAAGERLPVVATIAAGVTQARTLAPRTAARIMTGAVVPAGGDRVVPVEQTDDGDVSVRIEITPTAGAHIRRRAEVIARGARLLEAGSHLVPGTLSLLAAHGYQAIQVFARPRVAILVTGDEVVASSAQPAPGQLRDSNGPFLQAALAGLGLGAERLGIAPDERGPLAQCLRAGLAFDVLLVTGGVSMGTFDFAEELLRELGCELLVDAVAIAPGKPLVIGRHAGGWVFGLPGNPASVMVTFWLFVRPLLNRLMGREDGFWHGALAAETCSALPAGKGDRDRFLAATLRRRDQRLFADARLAHGSHDLRAYGQGRALLRIAPEAPPTPAGGLCSVLPLVDWPQDPS